MLSVRRLTISGLISVLLLTISAPIAVADFNYTCLEGAGCFYELTYTGTQPRVPPSQSVWRVADGPPDPCEYRQITPQPPPESPRWGGNDPTHGRLWQAFCPHAIVLGTNDGTMLLTGSDEYYVPDGAWPNENAPIDPQALRDEARGRVDIPNPAMNFGPDATEVAVKVPVWLWADPQPPIVETATAGPLTATVTATLVETSWEMGEPIDPDQPGRTPLAVTCPGSGTPFTVGANPANPPCGYTYIWRSLPQRTGGTGTWTVTATSTWEFIIVVTYPDGSADTETELVTAQSTAALQVREWRNALISAN